MANAHILEFSRFEFKYVLHKTQREAVEAELNYFMELDPFVAQKKDHRYEVRSLYFDDPARTAFADKIDGLKLRSKFRVRTYSRNEAGPAPVFLEEKGRIDNRVFKHRVALLDDLRAIDGRFDDQFMPTLMVPESGGDSALLDDFRYQTFRKGLAPVALIDYLRRPYISRYDHDFRVTFDEQLTGIETHLLFPLTTARSRRLLVGYTVMEVKFDTRVPAWFHRILQSFELRRVPMSKICEGMSTLGIAVDLS